MWELIQTLGFLLFLQIPLAIVAYGASKKAPRKAMKPQAYLARDSEIVDLELEDYNRSSTRK